MYQKSTALALQYGFTEMPALNLATQALEEAQCGLDATAREKSASALRQRNNFIVQSVVAGAYAFLGDTSQADRLIDEVAKEYPSDTILQTELVPGVKALSLLHQKKAGEAVAALETSPKYELGAPATDVTYLTIFVRGLAYLQLRDGSKAAAEFQKILDHPGLSQGAPLFLLAGLNLARAYALQNNTDKARVAYQNFLAEWKDADPDVPVLIAAKAEYDKLD